MLGHLVMLLSLAMPARQPAAERCERAFCRCISASALGVSSEELVRRQREQAARVVLGQVLRIDSLVPRLVKHGPDSVEVRELTARVAVSRIWKGPQVDTLTVVFGSTPLASSCDLTLQTGSSYVIFAVPYADGAFRTRQCSGTTAESDATATISALGPGEEPKK